MLDEVNPQAVAAFGSIAEHLPVVEAAAPRDIHVMVEKPLAFSVEDAGKMEALAKRQSEVVNLEAMQEPQGAGI
jgi:predicted dehydrogenase